MLWPQIVAAGLAATAAAVARFYCFWLANVHWLFIVVDVICESIGIIIKLFELRFSPIKTSSQVSLVYGIRRERGSTTREGEVG